MIEAFKREVEKAARGEGDKKDKEGKGRNGKGEEGDDRKGKKRRGKRQWDKRDYKAYDDNVELGTRGLKISLRRLRKLARTGADDEFDIDNTLRKTARNGGLLDIIMRPERRNTVKVLLFLDNGGSMDAHVRVRGNCSQRRDPSSSTLRPTTSTTSSMTVFGKNTSAG